MPSPLSLLAILLLYSHEPDTINYVEHQHWDEWRLRTDDGVSLFIREFGKGDTITVLHGGWGAEHSYLIAALAPLANEYHLIFYDQRGSLRSHCVDSLISVENHVEDLERIRKATGQKKLLLLGHSMGGYLAMSYLKKYPEHVKGMVLVSSAPAKGSIKQLTEEIQTPAMKRWSRREVTDTLEHYGLGIADWSSYSNRQSGLMHRITFAALNLHHVRNWRKVESAFDWQQSSAARAAESSSEEWDFTGDLKRAGFPITFIHGDDDYLPIDFHKNWIAAVPNAVLNTLRNAGHLCWIDEPSAFETFVRKALDMYR